MHSPYRIIQSSKTHTRKQNASNHAKQDPKVTSNDIKMTSNGPKETFIESVKSNRESKLKGGNPNDNNHSSGKDLIEPAYSFKKLSSSSFFVEDDICDTYIYTSIHAKGIITNL